MKFLSKACLGLSILGLTLAGCKNVEIGTENNAEAVPTTVTAATEINLAGFPLKKQFRCLPRGAAFIAAHRGVSKGAGFAENSERSLRALIEKGILFAELDVAGLKDGTSILYHDGVWEEKSTGFGAVAASNWEKTKQILLKDTDGKLTSDRPVRLGDVLKLAKDKMYLEIDFKSSAKYEAVIEAIRDADMGGRVILIAYSDAQARKLAQLAPEMVLSLGISDTRGITAFENQGVKRENMSAWAGRGDYDMARIKELQDAGIPILAWPFKSQVRSTTKFASLIVSDYAFDYDGIIGLSIDSKAAYESCLMGN